MLSRKPSTGCLQIPAQIAQIRIAADDTLKPKPTDQVRRLLMLSQIKTNYTALGEASYAATSQCAHASVAYGV